MTDPHKVMLLVLLRTAAYDDGQELDEGPLANLEIPTKGGGRVLIPIMELEGE